MKNNKYNTNMENTFCSSDYEGRMWDFDKISKTSNLVVKKGGSYLVKGDIIISKGHTFEIKNVDTVKFYKDCALIIEGEINVNNTGDKKTTFTSYKGGLIKKDEGWSNAWRGLIIKGKGEIKNCIFKDSIIGINVLNGDVKIFDNEIILHRYGIRCDKARVMIFNNKFEQCSDGIFLYYTKKAKIKKNKLLNNGCGVYCYFSSGKIEDNEIRVTEEEFKKPGYSGIYSYNSNLKVYKNFIIGPPYAITAGFNTILELKNNKLSSPKKLHIFNSYMRFNIHIFDPNSKFVCGDNSILKLNNNNIEIPCRSYEDKKGKRRFSFYESLTSSIPPLRLKEIIQPSKIEKLVNLIKNYNLNKKNNPPDNIKKIFDLSQKLKKYSLIYVNTKNKGYEKLIKKFIGESEHLIDEEVWRLHPCLDIPFSYCLNSYTLYYNSIKNNKNFLKEKKRIEKRVNELCEYLEWWIEEVKGANNHQDLLASSSLGIAALEFNSKKSKKWLELSRGIIKDFLENKRYPVYTETLVLLFEFDYYLRNMGLKNFIDYDKTDVLFKDFFGENVIENYLKKSLITS